MFGARPAKVALQFLQVIVGKNPHLRAAQPRGIHEAGMTQFIEDDHIL